jgi:hypothetical protein
VKPFGNEQAHRDKEEASHPVHSNDFERYCQKTVFVSSITATEKKYQPQHHPGADQYPSIDPAIAKGQGTQPREGIDVQQRHQGGQYGAKK